MAEHSVSFDPRPEYSDAVNARLRVVNDIAQRNAASISKRAQPSMKEFSNRATGILNAAVPVQQKIVAMWALADDMMKFTTGNVACKRGCSHCCHIAVAVAQPEADLIGKLIGRQAKQVTPVLNFVDFDTGYHNPCTFLRDGECSIYKHRPLACRIQYSADNDDLLCRLVKGQGIPVPYINTSDMNKLMAAVIHKADVSGFADIREYFSNGS
jgi:Fe-S-cluster containining protein